MTEFKFENVSFVIFVFFSDGMFVAPNPCNVENVFLEYDSQVSRCSSNLFVTHILYHNTYFVMWISPLVLYVVTQ